MIDLDAIKARNEARKASPYQMVARKDLGAMRSADGAEEDVDVLIAEVERLRKWLEGVRDFAERTMPHATGQAHLALMSLRSAAIKALDGEDEGNYRYRARGDEAGAEEKGVSCDCEFDPDPTDPDDDWHYRRTCQFCGRHWYGLHCPHDLIQNPCAHCGETPTVQP
jgi:hypothetical protein